MGIIRKQIARQAKLFKLVGFANGTLTRSTSGSRQVGNLAAGTQPTSQDYTCVVMVEKRTQFKSGTLVQEGRSLMTFLGGKVAVAPREGDTVLFRGVTYRVWKMETDPDEAVYECEVSH
jgi:hypothetical protein